MLWLGSELEKAKAAKMVVKERVKAKARAKESRIHNGPMAQKGKCKGKDSSKGKSNAGGGGKGYGQRRLDPNQCLYCHGYGHRKFQCRKYIADKAAGNVRQINDDGESTAAGASASGSSTVPTSAGVLTTGSAGGSGGGNQSVRKITSITSFVQDLTPLEEYVDASIGCFSHVTMLKQIDSFVI